MAFLVHAHCLSASQADVADEDDVNAALAAFRLAMGKRCFDAESEGQSKTHNCEWPAFGLLSYVEVLANVGC